PVAVALAGARNDSVAVPLGSTSPVPTPMGSPSWREWGRSPSLVNVMVTSSPGVRLSCGSLPSSPSTVNQNGCSLREPGAPTLCATTWNDAARRTARRSVSMAPASTPAAVLGLFRTIFGAPGGARRQSFGPPAPCAGAHVLPARDARAATHARRRGGGRPLPALPPVGPVVAPHHEPQAHRHPLPHRRLRLVPLRGARRARHARGAGDAADGPLPARPLRRPLHGPRHADALPLRDPHLLGVRQRVR